MAVALFIILAAALFGAALWLRKRAPIEDVVHEAEAAIQSEVASDAEALSIIADRFKEDFSEDWEALRLCPLVHGLETMIEKLKG